MRREATESSKLEAYLREAIQQEVREEAEYATSRASRAVNLCWFEDVLVTRL